MEDKEYKEIETYVYEQILNKEFPSKELSHLHTQMLTSCSAGNLEAKKYVKTLIKNILAGKRIKNEETEDLANKIFSNKWGLRLLDKFDTDDVDEIIVLGKEIVLKKGGKKIRVKEKFNDYSEVISIMHRCIEFNKKRDLNETNAIVTSSRADGARIHITIPEVSEYPLLNIRKFPFVGTTENMLKEGTFTQSHVDKMSTLVRGRANICIIGDPETGKSTTLSWLMSFLEDDLIIATMESDFELYAKKKYPNKLIMPLQERENYPMSVIFPGTLRQSVDLVIVSEVRKSYEALEYANAATRGLSGSMTTFHDRSALSTINNLARLVVMEKGANIDFAAMKHLFADAIDVIIKMRKLPKDSDGKQKKICDGIYEIIANDEDMSFNVVPIMKLEINEENPEKSCKHQYLNSISDKLKLKLNENGVKMSEIKRVFGDADV